jgi:hypothetical protein
MPATTLEIIVPIFNFSGAAILCIDALRIKQNIKEKVGAKELLDYLQAFNKPGAVRDEQGKPLDSQEAIDKWLAHRSLQFGWIGFILLALGFLLDLIAKLQ